MTCHRNKGPYIQAGAFRRLIIYHKSCQSHPLLVWWSECVPCSKCMQACRPDSHWRTKPAVVWYPALVKTFVTQNCWRDRQSVLFWSYLPLLPLLYFLFTKRELSFQLHAITVTLSSGTIGMDNWECYYYYYLVSKYNTVSICWNLLKWGRLENYNSPSLSRDHIKYYFLLSGNPSHSSRYFTTRSMSLHFLYYWLLISGLFPPNTIAICSFIRKQ